MYILSLKKKQVDIFLVREMWLLCFLRSQCCDWLVCLVVPLSQLTSAQRMVPSCWLQTSATKSGFTLVQTGPNHSIWSRTHIGSSSTSHLLRWVKPVTHSKRSITLGASSRLWKKWSDFWAGYDGGWIFTLLQLLQSILLRMLVFLRLWVGWFPGVCQH